MVLPLLCLIACSQSPELTSNGLAGYINMSVSKPPAGYAYGVSLYSSAWPLLKEPLANFQIGLASTWILPDNHDFKEPLVPRGTVARDSMPERGPSFWTVFQTIEGGLGFWASNKFMAGTAKFRMNGTPDGYNHEISTPGWEFEGRPLPGDQMGLVQISNRMLVPPDGVTLAKQTCGELFGYAWMALPWVDAKEKPVATGNQCWTSFFNTKNFRGPVAFYLPVTWSRMSQNYSTAVGRGLDALPAIADSGAIEINTVPQFVSAQTGSVSFHKIPELSFPVDAKGQTVLMHDFTVYSKEALWNDVEAWRKGVSTAAGRFNAGGAYLANIQANPLEVRQGGSEAISGIEGSVRTAKLDEHTFGLEWQSKAVVPWNGQFRRGVFPSYFRHEGKKAAAVASQDVPPQTGLLEAKFPLADQTKSYEPSTEGGNVWRNPGPKAGPFRVNLSDGSTVTYYWYRFADQPAMVHSGLSAKEKQNLQKLIEKVQRTWTPDKQYMAPPQRGTLAALDPGLIVQPPKGLEIGYVPVAIRQDPGDR